MALSAYRTRIHAYARTDVWHARSLRFRTARKFRCRACGRVSRSNHAHHLSYARAFAGKEPDSDLMCLCSRCHAQAHDFSRQHPGMSLRAATFKALGIRRTVRERLAR